MPGRFIGPSLICLGLAHYCASPALAQGESELARDMGFLARIADHIEVHFDKVREILAAAPQIPEQLALAFTTIAHSSPPSLHPLLPPAVAAAIALLVLTLPRVLHVATARWLRHKLAFDTRFGRAVALIVVDVATFAIAVALAAFLVNLLLRRHLLIGQLGVALIGAAVRWQLTMLVPEILLRPRHAELRLVAVDDGKARLAERVAGMVLAVGIVFITALPVLLAAGLPQRSAQALALMVGTLMAVGGTYGVYRIFDGVHGRDALVALLLIAVTWLAWSSAVVIVDFTLYHGLVWSMGIVAAVIGLDRLLALKLHPAGEEAVKQPSPARTLVAVTLRRVAFAVAGTIVAGLVARLWLVDLLGIVDKEAWVHVREAVITALAVLVAGYVAYQVLSAWIEAKLGSASSAVRPGGAQEDVVPASRFASVLPVLRGVFGTLIVATASLVALSHLGVSVGPLIAGAGIFGLAVSFGSQALVRDIVSGVFYLSDDAFRVGEYITAGSHKGTVERIAIRSLRLRHQNGQIHTIPYGQLGAVTNFSRDYLTVKFNLRLARNTDVEKVRKLTKRLGQEMLEDPELGKEFIQPFKLQGVADIQENALVCRFKFTSRPAKPTWLQREALKRLYALFTTEGVEFATNAVVVQTAPGTTPEASAAGARASVLAFPRSEER